jgi:hypothetical protein
MATIIGYKKDKKTINPPSIENYDNITQEKEEELKFFLVEKIKFKGDIELENRHHYTQFENELINKFFTKEDIIKFQKSESVFWKRVLFGIASLFILGLVLEIIKNPYGVIFYAVYSLFWIGVIILVIYFITGVKTSNWWKDYQKYLLITSIVILALNGQLEYELTPHLIKYNVYGKGIKFWHFTGATSDKTWIRLKLDMDKTYEIWAVRPNAESWGASTKGKLSEVSKQRYTDNGKVYYAVYLEDFPFSGERSMLTFDDAFDDLISLVVDKKIYTLMEGDDYNPWKNR